ncbi:hypothetical protein ELE36_11750 [Pseudolysobacter antarcticus]|uniref:Uncharacterized protein n=1 Tax=Pseudolysobacter antarcticus TaxID=2511995 RepID=A0A411HKQ6_9GAMM|nr:hypothetical protein [Pseudolysobacter antarcticus]QBB70967.1 hypothetical protein ELE36_11750 [Pseudolysobacter antarcticus]
MNLGLLDLPAPLLDTLDSALTALALPTLVRMIIYAIASAWLGMILYRRFSDQAALTDLRQKVQASQRALALHAGDFTELRGLIRNNFLLSLRQLGLSLRPALLASLPLLFLMPWLSNRFAFEPPPTGASINVCAEPISAIPLLRWQPADTAIIIDSGCWQVNSPRTAASSELVDNTGRSLLSIPDAHTSGIKHKHIWLNYLIGNPAGYLPDDAPVQALHITLPPRELIHLGPSWMRGWEFSYFLIVFGASIWLKLRWRLS